MTVCTRIFVLAAVIACGKDAAPSGDDEPAVDANVPAGYARLIVGSWDLPAGANAYRCVRVTIAEEMFITSIKAESPIGTHHAVLALADETTGGPDGERDCDAGTIGRIMVYASSVGTSPFEFPAGVGLKVAAGQQLHLNVHLLNLGDEALHGETAIWVKAEATPPTMLAEMVLAGPLAIDVPSDNQPHTVAGECTATAPYTLFALWPHMHTFATRQRVELVRTDDALVLHDEPFVFEEQRYYSMHPMQSVATGEKIRVSCTYVNSSGSVVKYGDGAGSEMCFAGLYRYPAADSYEYCGN
jgi:hypothetical protein